MMELQAFDNFDAYLTNYLKKIVKARFRLENISSNPLGIYFD